VTDPARLLGFAFANADFLFEVDAKGTVVFSLGAASEFTEGEVVGRPATHLFAPSEGAKFTTLSRSVGKGDRAGPFRLKLAGGKDVALAMFRLPEKKEISCTLSKPGTRAVAAVDPKTGLSNREGFLAAAAQLAGEDDALTLVDLPGLPGMIAGMSEAEAGQLYSRIGTAFASLGAKATGQLSASRFGIIAESVGGMAKLGQKIRAALAESGAGTLDVQETLVALKGKDLSDAQRNLVLRYVVDKFAKGEMKGGAQTDAAAEFAQVMDETQQRLRKLTETVADGSFTMAYQRIVNLKTGEVAHYEALAQFAGGQTAEMVGMAEALGVSDAFDLEVAMKVLGVAESRGGRGQHVAFNVSGRTIGTPANFGLLAGLLARKRAVATGLLVEITESAQIDSLEDAAKAVTALHALGYRVGIDDFGVGAATMSYLHALPVDFVKFDGALIEKLGRTRRDDLLLAGMVKLCKEIGVKTVAERIETQEQADAAKAMGFDLGQGYFFGRSAPELPAPTTAGNIFAKRRGVQETWG
jgi:EAL domain-containing protein (putative c-di-GMP-specific phosphodiesterase class I)